MSVFVRRALDLSPSAGLSWRMFAAFAPDGGPGRGTVFVLSRTVTVPGAVTTTALPAAATSTTVDGCRKVQGDLTAGTEHPPTVTIRGNARPVRGA